MGAPRKVKTTAALGAAAAIAIFAIAASAAALPVNWRDRASDFDINRLQLLEQWRDKAVREAQTYSDGAGDFNVLKTVLEPAIAESLDSRAFVHWNMKNSDAAIVDYDAALAINSRLATSLYGRALVKRAKGDQKGASDDLNAAMVVKPDIAAQFAKLMRLAPSSK